MLSRRLFTGLVLAGLVPVPGIAATEATDRDALTRDVLLTWNRLVLELVRHTATYSPPVAARAFACTGITAWEVLAGLHPEHRKSLAGQVNALTTPPAPTAPGIDPAAAMHGAMAFSVRHYFGNTGPTGQRAMRAMDSRLAERVAEGMAEDVVTRSLEHGRDVALHIIEWARHDGGEVVENMGFPRTWALGTQPGHWEPTSKIVQQQAPLLPDWPKNRPMAMPSADACGLSGPPEYSEAPASEFHAQAVEVYESVRNLTAEQKLIARFWSDDPMLSPTPPGHWIAILLEITERDDLPADRLADALARLGIAVSDAFIACWQAKYQFDLIRPVTYIRRHIDPSFEPLLITPPFPEYPSGHSTQSGAAASVLTAIFGDNFAFDDVTHVDDGLPMRTFPSFHAAAEEAAISRLYGGIHFRAAIENGLSQGECVGEFVNRLVTFQ